MFAFGYIVSTMPWELFPKETNIKLNSINIFMDLDTNVFSFMVPDFKKTNRHYRLK